MHLSTTENRKRNILLLEATTDETQQLRLSEERKIITDACKRSRRREEFGIEVRTGATGGDLRRAILDFKPEVVHVCGHGSGAKGIAFQSDTTSAAQIISTDAVADTFRLSAKYGTVCVVFNVCHSEIQATQVVKHIPYVVGMRNEISDQAALKFAEGFYDSLFAGEPFGDCFEWGVNAIHSAGIPEYSTPRLKVRDPQFSKTQMVCDRFYYEDLVEAPIPLEGTGFSIQRAHALVWRIFDTETGKISYIEQTFLNLRSDQDDLILPYTSEWVFEETRREAETIYTLADINRIRRIPLDDFTLSTSDQDRLNRFEAAKRSLFSKCPAGDAKWRMNDKGQLVKVFD